ncbi:Cytochrome P450 [Stemphylium lycopersici]|uniref:Cytochrome P450 n=1 Tax=Stemphylium lycopersici TaxID=183478 RepID=A0A364N0T1_STELY|nr:Cytochrome P450 [Stemphylium lycopersici]
MPLGWYFVSIALLWLAYQSTHKLWRRNLVRAPLVFSEMDTKTRTNVWMTKCDEVLGAGYKMLKNGLPMFRVTVDDGSEVLILNDRYLKELKMLPDSALNFAAAINSDLLAEYSHVKVAGPVGQHAIRSDLTPRLSRLMPSIASETVFALKHYFPWESGDWTPIIAFEAALNAVAQVSARLFVGEKLCRDPRWLRSSKASTMMAFATILAMKRWPGWVRPLVYRFVPEARELEKARAEAKGLLRAAAKAQLGRGSESPEDFLAHWVISKNPAWAQDYDAQVDLQLELSVAAIHTTTNAFTNMIFDLAAHPEYVQILRDEIKAALAKSQ